MSCADKALHHATQCTLLLSCMVTERGGGFLLDPNKCVICSRGRRTRNSVGSVLNQIVTQESANKIQKAAEEKQDDVFLRVNGVGLVALGSKYHASCRASYVLRGDGDHGAGKQSTPTRTDENEGAEARDWQISLNSFIKEVGQKLVHQKHFNSEIQ